MGDWIIRDTLKILVACTAVMVMAGAILLIAIPVIMGVMVLLAKILG